MTGTRRVAITGATGDFGRSILGWALASDEIGEVTVLGRRSTGLRHPKLREAKLDLSADFDLDAVTGYDALLHLAYCVEEPRNKRRARQVNVVATKTLLDEANRVGVGHLVLTSSANALGVSACGTGTQLPEAAYPAGDGDSAHYYFQHKALLEHLANWYWSQAVGDTKLAVVRPCYVVGEHFDNSGLQAFLAKVIVFPEPARSFYQFLWDTDLVDAYATVVEREFTGIVNVAPVDQTSVAEIAAINGARLITAPLPVLEVGADLMFRCRVAPFSSHWVTLGDPLLDSTLLRNSTDWRPSASSADALRRYISVKQQTN